MQINDQDDNDEKDDDTSSRDDQLSKSDDNEKDDNKKTSSIQDLLDKFVNNSNTVANAASPKNPENYGTDWQQRKQQLDSLKDKTPSTMETSPEAVKSTYLDPRDYKAQDKVPSALPQTQAPSIDDSNEESDKQDETPSTSTDDTSPTDKIASIVSNNKNDDDDENKTPPTTSNYKQFSSDRLAQLQHRANKLQAINMAARGITNAVATGGMQKNPFDQQFADNETIIGQEPKQYAARAELAKYDPNSPASQTSRNLAKYIDPDMKITNDMSASDLEKVLPQMANVRSAYEAHQAHMEGIKAQLEEKRYHDQTLALGKQQAFEAAQDKRDNNDVVKLGTAINFNKQARGNAPQIANLVNYGQRIQTIMDNLPKLVNGEPDLSKMPVGQKPLFIDAMNNIVAGKASISGGQELTEANKSMAGDASRLMQYISGGPQSGHEGAILQNLVHVLNQEVDFAKEKEKDLVYQGATPFQRLRDSKTADWNNIMNSHGMDGVDYKMRELGAEGYDINRLTQMGYTKSDMLEFLMKGKSLNSIKKPKEIDPNSPIAQAAMSQAASVVSKDKLAQAKTASRQTSSQPPASSGNPAMDAVNAEIARRKALKAQGGQ